MLKRRIIPVLLLRGDRVVKGKQFTDFRDTGNPVMATRVYNAQAADELLFLDIEATVTGRSRLTEILSRVSEEAFMPFAVGGGIRTKADVRALIAAGADKVVITTAAVETPQVVSEVAETFGSQCVVAGVDVRREGDRYMVYARSGRVRTELELQEHVRKLDELGAGEILINSIDQDGMMGGYDLDMLARAVEATNKPVIVCGGAGNFRHLEDGLRAGAHAVACASLFHFGDNNPPRARAYLKNAGFPVKTV